jgi:predicted nucleic acid-binding protein
MYLLDTNVISELRKRKPHGAVTAWVRATRAELHLCAATLGEIQAGIELTREQDAAKAAEIEAWTDQLVRTWSILPLDAAVFREFARLMHRRSAQLFSDAMIAATARVHRLVVATRNERDFQFFGVPVFNPFTTRSEPL